jgi:tetratricopeptide (TPR) repeat protein
MCRKFRLLDHRNVADFHTARAVAKVIVVVTLVVTCASAQTDPKTAMLARAGWDALASNQPREAADAFREAIARDPRNADLHLGAGTAAYLERRDQDARTALERALGLSPTLALARELLGLVLYRSGDVLAAVRAYERLPDTPEYEPARLRLERWRREADLHGRMTSVAGAWFTVSFEGDADAELAARALASIERAADRIGQVLSTYPLQPISVVLYTTEQFRDITRAPIWAGGAYDGTVRVPMRGALANPQELDRVLAHEYTHALVHSLATRNVPAWLHEGLAAALETDLNQVNGAASSEPLPAGALAALQSSFGRFTGDQARLAYDVSARAARQLLDEAGGFAVANLLRDLGQGVDFNEAFLHRIQRPFASFEADLSTPR